MATAAPSSHSNILLRLLICLLEAVDAVSRRLYTTWYCLTHGIGPAKAGGTNPPPPSDVGIIIAEPNAQEISLQMVANVAGWCMLYSSVKQLHLYEPSGQLKRSQPLLEEKLAAVAEREGRNLVIKCGWSVSKPSHVTSARQQQQRQQHRSVHGQQQQHHSTRLTQQRSWSMWLTQQIVRTDRQQPDRTPQQEIQQAEAPRDNNFTHHQEQNLQQQQQQQERDTALEHGTAQAESPGDSSSVHQHHGSHARQACNSTVLQAAGHTRQQQSEMSGAGTNLGMLGSDGYRVEHMDGIRSSSRYTAGAVAAAGGVGATAAAVTVRILSAEDAFFPVIEAAAERCRTVEQPGTATPSSDMQQVQPRDQDQQQQQCQEQRQQDLHSGVHDDSCGASSKKVGETCCSGSMQSCSCGTSIKLDGEAGNACTCPQPSAPCTGLRCLQENMGTPAAVAQQENMQQQQQQYDDQHVATAADSSIHVQQRASQQQLCSKLSPASQQEQKQPTTQACPSAETAALQQQQKPPQKQQGSMLPELASVSDADVVEEPQLLLVFGPALTLAGYPPFHTRAAEVHHMGSLAKASRHGVAGAMATYCKVLQRHGA